MTLLNAACSAGETHQFIVSQYHSLHLDIKSTSSMTLGIDTNPSSTAPLASFGMMDIVLATQEIASVRTSLFSFVGDADNVS